MAAIAAIAIVDAQATPVMHTFAPAKTQSDYALFEDRAAGTYIGFNKLTFALRRPQGPSNNASRSLKLSIKVETPKLEVVSNNTITGIAPAPTVSYRPWAEVLCDFPERCSLQDRQDLRAFLRNVLGSAAAQLAFDQYELPY